MKKQINTILRKFESEEIACKQIFCNLNVTKIFTSFNEKLR